ncbi:unnamed protein product [Caenorhabditis auriculariae]|uniref:Tropomodulin n=1 Tax=Caenorhabditis auriculariae TaxID=2777116 RepID=A0A8S1GNV0_9PELO|nr:unnamed protein product [Caenorhabditis auriculariae]
MSTILETLLMKYDSLPPNLLLVYPEGFAMSLSGASDEKEDRIASFAEAIQVYLHDGIEKLLFRYEEPKGSGEKTNFFYGRLTPETETNTPLQNIDIDLMVQNLRDNTFKTFQIEQRQNPISPPKPATQGLPEQLAAALAKLPSKEQVEGNADLLAQLNLEVEQIRAIVNGLINDSALPDVVNNDEQTSLMVEFGRHWRESLAEMKQSVEELKEKRGVEETLCSEWSPPSRQLRSTGIDCRRLLPLLSGKPERWSRPEDWRTLPGPVLSHYSSSRSSCPKRQETFKLSSVGAAPRLGCTPVAMSKTDYYSEQQTFNVPAANTQKGAGLPPQKIYGKGLKDLEDTDIEGLLSKLSIDELEDLNNDFDPDNSMLPPSQRCRDQTDKEPTGPYKRDNLLKFLEEKAKNEKDWEDVSPFTPGLKRGKIWEGDSGRNSEEPESGKMEMPIELDLDDDDELECALIDAPEKDLVDLAGILGMHNVLNQPQYYNALKGKMQDDSTGTTFNGIVQSYQPRIVPDEPDNETDVDDCIKRLHADDESLTDVNLNNMKRVSKERIRSVIEAACNSKHIQKLALANTAISDSEARGIVELLETSPSLRILNVESNFLTPELLARLLRATLVTQTLVEFKAENQRQSVLGNQIEMDMMMSVEENETLLRVGVAFQSMEARHRVSEALERNYERVRLRRLGKDPNM